MNYAFFASLQQQFSVPDQGILSKILHKDENVNITAFGFSAGQELSGHSSPTPAILYFLEGSADVQLGEQHVEAQPDSFVYMPPMLPHGILARTATKMLLIQFKTPVN